MQNVIDDLKRRMDDLAATMQRLVPTARVGAVTYRDRDDDRGAPGGPRQSEAFVVKWTDLTFNVKKVQTFLDGIVAEGGGDWEEAVKDGLECAMRQLKWRGDAKKVIILVGSSPPHPQDVAAIHKLIADWRAKGVTVCLHEHQVAPQRGPEGGLAAPRVLQGGERQLRRDGAGGRRADDRHGPAEHARPPPPRAHLRAHLGARRGAHRARLLTRKGESRWRTSTSISST